MTAALRVMHGMRQRGKGRVGGEMGGGGEKVWRMRRPEIVHERVRARAPCAPWAEGAAACVAAPALPSATAAPAAAAGRARGGKASGPPRRRL